VRELDAARRRFDDVPLGDGARLSFYGALDGCCRTTGGHSGVVNGSANAYVTR